MAVSRISKQNAAQLQLDAAIRMLFLHQENLCAIHTVAAAAFGILKDLAEASGVGHTYETRRALVRFYSEHLGADPENPDTAAEIDRSAKEIAKLGTDWKAMTRIGNFLKHAKDDPNDVLDPEEFDTISVIIESINLYINMNQPITIEMQIYSQWWLGITAQNPEDFKVSDEGPIHMFNFERQIDYARGLLISAYEKQGPSSRRLTPRATGEG